MSNKKINFFEPPGRQKETPNAAYFDIFPLYVPAFMPPHCMLLKVFMQNLRRAGAKAGQLPYRPCRLNFI